MRATPRSNGATPGPTRPASQPTTASSITVAVTAGPRRPRPKITKVSPTSTTAATSQPTPLVCSRYGNAGGAPVGRRRRGDRTPSRRVGWIGGALVGVDWPAGTSIASPNPGTAQARHDDLVCWGSGLSSAKRAPDQPLKADAVRAAAQQAAPQVEGGDRSLVILPTAGRRHRDATGSSARWVTQAALLHCAEPE